MYRTRDQVILGKIQSGVGVEATPVPGVDAIKTGMPVFAANFDTNDPDYVQSSVSHAPPQTGGGQVTMRIPNWLRGAGTAGAAPDYSDLLRACGMAETLIAAPVTGTATAGAAGSITLAAGASAVNDAYKGAVITTTGGTGAGQSRVISGYVGSTKVASVYPNWVTPPDATTTYSIGAAAIYRPITAGQEYVTLWAYVNQVVGQSKRRRIMDAMGSFVINATPRGVIGIDFTMTGKMPAVPDDVTALTGLVLAPGNPPPVLQAQTYLGGNLVKWADFSFDMGNTVNQFDDASSVNGYAEAYIADRAPTGQITPDLNTTAIRDTYTDWMNSTARPFWMNLGLVGGNKVSLFIPDLRYTGNAETDVRGTFAERIPFRAVSPDAEMYLAIG
jgi:hypothetical protein